MLVVIYIKKDKKKTEELWDAGWDVIRVREEPLPLITPLDISVSRYNTKKKMKCMVDDVLCRIQEISKVNLDGLDEYLAQTDLLTAAASESYYKRLPGRIKMKRPNCAAMDGRPETWRPLCTHPQTIDLSAALQGSCRE